MTTVHIVTGGSSQNTKITVDGVDISAAIQGFKVEEHVGDLFTVQLEAFASLEADIEVEHLDIVEGPRMDTKLTVNQSDIVEGPREI